MKKQNLSKQLWLISIGFYSTSVLGIDLTLNPNTINYTNPSDSVNDFDLLTGGWNAMGSEDSLCRGSGLSLTRGVIVSSSKLSGYSTVIDGVTYSIFVSDLAGVGWIMGAKDTHAPTWTPLTQNETKVFPYPGGVESYPNLGANFRFAFVKLPGVLAVGNNVFPTQKIADFRCYKDSSFVQSAAISVRATNINVNALSCQVQSSPSVSIPLGEHFTTDLPSVNENFGSYSTQVELKCDSGIVPWMTISDASNAGNTSNIIELSSDSTAKGIGVQVFYNSVAKLMGPDSSSKGNKNQFQIANKTTLNNQIISIPLNFKYIRTQESVSSGKANAAATVTFSYQ